MTDAEKVRAIKDMLSDERNNLEVFLPISKQVMGSEAGRMNLFVKNTKGQECLRISLRDAFSLVEQEAANNARILPVMVAKHPIPVKSGAEYVLIDRKQYDKLIENQK